MGDAPIIGIDLGIKYSRVSIIQNGKTQIIPIDGFNKMASYVCFYKGYRMIGNESLENSGNKIFDINRIIGRRFQDEVVQQYIKDVPFEVVNIDDNVKIKIQRNKEHVLYSPEEISAMILKELRENAERYLNTIIQKAVITVPAYFNESQRQATKNAGRIAGLEVQIINEPTAAILAYGFDRKYKSNVLVYNFGRYTFDVSIITINNGVFELKATDVNTNLGGNDIDIRLVNHFISVFKTEFDIDLQNNALAKRRLRAQSEKLTIKLYSADRATLEIDGLYRRYNLYKCIMRSDFERMCKDIFFETLKCITNALRAANMYIQEIVMIGSSTRIPIVQELVKRFFDGKELNTFLDPEETVAIGASVQANILTRDKSDANGICKVTAKENEKEKNTLNINVKGNSENVTVVMGDSTTYGCK